jgi:neopullulanase
MTIDTPAWVRDAVFYQIFPDRFARSGRVHAPGPLEPWAAPPTTDGFKGGDLYGVVDHLDHLVDLGVNALYLNPIFASASNHRYHTYDYLAVDPLLGGEPAFRALLDEAHARGIRVMIDGVFNHCGRGFWAFHHVMETGGASPYRDWFTLEPSFLENPGSLRAYATETGPPLDLSAMNLGDRDGSRSLRELGYQAWWDLPALPKLNVRNPEVREYLLGVAEHWIRFGADGWRLDVPEDLGDPDFWREFRRRVRAVDPAAYVLAEIWFAKPEVLAGDQYDAIMNYELMTAVASFAGGAHLDRSVANEHGWLAAGVRPEDGPAFADRLVRSMTQFDPAVIACQYNLLGSHDTPRILSVFGGDVASVRIATLIEMTLPGAPAIYYGDEIGMTGSIDPFARAAFPWDRPETWDRDLLGYMSAAVRLRHEHPVLRHGTFRVAAAAGSAVAWLRSREDDAAVGAFNNGEEEVMLEVEVPLPTGTTLRQLALPGDPTDPPVDVVDGRTRLRIPARSGRVLHS